MAKRTGRNYNPLPWVRGHKLYSLLLAIAVLTLGFFVYEKIALELNRRAFQSARNIIDIVYADIVKQVGPPDNSESINECSKAHRELGREPLSCSVNTEFIYGVDDKTQADDLTKKIKATVANHADIFKPVSAPKSEIPITLSIHDVSDSEVNYYSAANLFCTIKYTFNMPRESDLMLRSSPKKLPFSVAIVCSSDARAAFYQIRN